MVITILAEPRSGSTNLAKWFGANTEFSVLFEPSNYDMRNINRNAYNLSPKLWKYNTKHLLVKEIYNTDYPYIKELIDISDKLIILHREDVKSQEESWINAFNTGNWDNAWVYRVPNSAPNEFCAGLYSIKDALKRDFIDSNQHFNISYEELYYNNGIQRIVDYIDLPEVQNTGFPYGTKYRVDAIVKKLL